VSCPHAGACTAVGYFANSAGDSMLLAEQRDATGWVIQDIPEPADAVLAYLDAVSCTSANACTAVGSYSTPTTNMPLFERWNGTRWSIQAIPAPAPALGSDAQFSAVSCASANACTAVGSYTTTSSQSAPLAAAWDGTRWSLQTVPDPAGPGELLAVSCASPRACTAVGDYGTDVWNGTSWRYLPISEPAGTQSATLSAVSCTAPDACTAVGNYTADTTLNLAERWNGSTWTVQATPNLDGSVFTAVSCASATACTAVAGDFAETWDGTGWSLQAMPLPPTGYPTGVSCTTAGCVAVGSATGTAVSTLGGGAGTQVTLALATSG
jgi:hypothetical protein